MVNWSGKKLGDYLLIANIVVLVILINVLATDYFFRIDLTEENRFTINDQTRTLLKSLDDDVYVEVYLEGELNAGFRRFRKNIEETLEEFRIYSGNKLHYTFTDPAIAAGQNARSEFMRELAAKGIQPTNVVDKKDGQRVEKIIFPGAVVTYGGFEAGVMLLKGNKSAPSEEVINQSVEGIEFELANAIYKLANTNRKRVGFIQGHGELDSLRIASLKNELLGIYDLNRVDLSHKTELSKYEVLVVAKPVSPYSEIEKLRLDQYIMRGGKVVFLVDKLEATMDSATMENYFAFPYQHNLDDQLFRYGARINLDLVQDQQASLYPVITGEVGGKPQVQMLDWPFFPLLSNYPAHPITRNLDAVQMKFVSSIDTVKAPGIRKIPLLYTSQYSRVLGAPVNISVNQLRLIKPGDFATRNIPVAYLLEGKFTSLYKNRFLPEGSDSTGFEPEGKETKIVVIADGDLARNEINPRSGQPLDLGFDPFTNYTFANKDFLLNVFAYLTNEGGLIQTRNKQVKIRPLDKTKIQAEKSYWQAVNIVAPLVLLVMVGVIRSVIRKRKYARFS
jgi:ABC-2 type transport system permease protein